MDKDDEERSGFQDSVELPRTIHLVSHRTAAIPAPVLVFVPFRQNQQQRFSDRYGLPAFGTIELGSLKLIKSCLRFFRKLCVEGIKGISTHGQNLWISNRDCAIGLMFSDAHFFGVSLVIGLWCQKIFSFKYKDSMS